MVTGLYALMPGVQPRQGRASFLAVHVNSVEWGELQNTLDWSLPVRHQETLARNPRMARQAKNLARPDGAQRPAINERAAAIRGGAAGVAQHG